MRNSLLVAGFVLASAGSGWAQPADFEATMTYPILGGRIGQSNFVSVPQPDGPPRLYAGGGLPYTYSPGGGPDTYWYALQHEPDGSYEPVFVSEFFGHSIRNIALGDVIGDGNLELVVAIADGVIAIYDERSLSLLGKFVTLANDLQGIAVADANGDGEAEIFVSTSTSFYAYSGNGALLWSLAGAGGAMLQVGQMDTDPALELATTAVQVVDLGSHSVQWTRGGAAAETIAIGDVDHDGRQELVVGELLGPKPVTAYDVELGTAKWTLGSFGNVDALLVNAADAGAPILMVAEHWAIYGYELETRTLVWTAPNPEYGVTALHLADLDEDGTRELIWGSGDKSGGPDTLVIADATTRHVEWQSIDLGGPLLGPEIGDLDGDGTRELVVASTESDSGYGSGRLLIFDESLRKLLLSVEVSGGLSLSGIWDMKVRDLDHDGRAEILVGTERVFDARIEVYNLDSSSALHLTGVLDAADHIVEGIEVADLDGDGQNEVIAVLGRAASAAGPEGIRVYAYNYPLFTERWHSARLGTYYFNSVRGLVVTNSDRDPTPEIHVLLEQPQDIRIFDGVTGQLEKTLTGQYTAIASAVRPPGNNTLYTGDALGILTVLRNQGQSSYQVAFAQKVSDSRIDGISDLGHSLWIGAGRRISRFRQNGPHLLLSWTSRDYGPYAGRRTGAAGSSFDSAVTASWYTVLGFPAGRP